MGEDISFTDPNRDRWFEDYRPGESHVLGEVSAGEAEMIAFARAYDPQHIHTSPEMASAGPFGGVIASGWLTAGLMMRVYARHYLSDCSSMASPGIEALRWYAPVRPDDVLTVKVDILDARPSRSKPDRGVVKTAISVANQEGTEVMSLECVNMIARRPGA